MNPKRPSPKTASVPTGERSLWHSPPNSRFEALEALSLKPPTPSEVSAIREAVREETRSRAEAYRTPVTEETLLRNIR